ncbi:hypothetical protein [Bogoriella caseilytica]|nr:hypothetical protein [Bogoriella caseilytica]
MDAAFRYGGALALFLVFWLLFSATGNGTLGLYVGGGAALIWLAFGLLVGRKQLREARAVRRQQDEQTP